MKKFFLLLTCFAVTAISFAQKEKFDVINYDAPIGWKKGTEENLISYTSVKNNTWCRINIVKSTISKGNIDQDFENEWQEMVVKNYKPTDEPGSSEAEEADGWKIKAGGSKFMFDSIEAKVFLVTATGFDRCASVVAVTNSDGFMSDIETFFASIKLEELTSTSSQADPVNSGTPKNTNTANEPSIIATWVKSESNNSNYSVQNGVMSYIKRQYTFNSNGTYNFYSKTYDPFNNKMLLGRENGTYIISGNNITVTPQKNVLEGWSKNENRDQWGKKLNSQNLPLEKATYTFTKTYSEVMKRWDLVLQGNNETKRDGYFSSVKNFGNAYFYAEVAFNNPAIVLP